MVEAKARQNAVGRVIVRMMSCIPTASAEIYNEPIPVRLDATRTRLRVGSDLKCRRRV